MSMVAFSTTLTPPKMSTEAGGVTFPTTGVRVPAFIISPYVTPGSVFSEQVDSTSILQLLADKYTPGKDYSAACGGAESAAKTSGKYFERVTRDRAGEADLAGLAEGARERRADGNRTKRASFCDLASVSASLVRDVQTLHFVDLCGNIFAREGIIKKGRQSMMTNWLSPITAILRSERSFGRDRGASFGTHTPGTHASFSGPKGQISCYLLDGT